MNNQLLIIVIIVLLIVLVSFLIINKKPTESFHSGVNCDDVASKTVCDKFPATCRFIDNECKHKCDFEPASIFNESSDAATQAQKFGMVTTQVGDIVSYEFKSEATDGVFQACVNTCRAHTTGDNFCNIDDCKTNCRTYIKDKKNESDRITGCVRYHNYPTDQISSAKYNDIKATVLSQMVDPNSGYKQSIRDAIYGGDISKQVFGQDTFEDETDKIASIYTQLNSLKSTGNDFIQQMDQMGSFQDKYSSKIDRLLNEKRTSESGFDKKILSLSRKMETLNDLYSNYNTSRGSDTPAIAFHKTATSLSNGNILYFTPVIYTDTDGNRKIYQNGAYLIGSNTTTTAHRDAVADTSFLYVEPKKEVGGNPILCNPNELTCSYKLTSGANRTGDGPNEIDLSSEANILGKSYVGNTDLQRKRQAYFNVIEITNNDEYNSIIIKAPNGTRNLVKNNEIINYPFYVIQSIELPGYLINITTKPVAGTSAATSYKIDLSPADKRGTEKFMVDDVDGSDCQSAGSAPPL